jgi:hypothetical protein
LHLQQLVHLLQLELVVGDYVEHAFLTLDFAFAALEVEPRPDLAGNSRKGVVDFGKLDPRNDVEAGHGRLLRLNSDFSPI